MAWIKHYASKLAYLLWLTPSGQVAHVTLDRRLCRTRIFSLENMINWEGKDKDLLALIKYIADEDKLEKVLENPQVIKTPVVRNGKQSTLGYQPDIWKGWN